MFSGALIGHSFAISYRDHLKSPSAEGTAKLLLVSNKCSRVDIYGERGACILHEDFHMPLEILSQRHDFCLLDYGSNDLAEGTAYDRVSEKVFTLANSLINVHDAQIVVICGVVPRAGYISPGINFQEAMKAYNTHIFNNCRDNGNGQIFFKSHNGFWANPIDAWSRDKIHPNAKLGRKLYRSSIRQMCLFACSKLIK